MDENVTINETEAVEEIAKVAGGLSKGAKFGIAGIAIGLVGTGVAAWFIAKKVKKDRANKLAAEDIAFRNAKVVEGGYDPDKEDQ